MTVASEAAVRAAAARYWVGRDVDMAVEIGRIESRFNTRAYNGVGRDRSYGVMQINMNDNENGLGTARRAQFGLTSNEQLFDLDTNMRVAHGIWLQNGRSFFGSAAWSTSAIAAAAKLGITGGSSGGGGSAGFLSGDDDGDLPQPWTTQAELDLWHTVDDAMGTSWILDIRDNAKDGEPLPAKPSELSAEQWALVTRYYNYWAGDPDTGDVGGLTGLGLALNPLSNPLSSLTDWAAGLKKFFEIILDPTFWKRIGLGVLGAVVILLAVVFFAKSEVTSTAKDALSE